MSKEIEIKNKIELSDASGGIALVLVQIIAAYIRHCKEIAPFVPGEFIEELSGNYVNPDPHDDNLVKNAIHRLWMLRLTGICDGLEIYAAGQHPNFEEIGQKAFREFGRWATHLTI